MKSTRVFRYSAHLLIGLIVAATLRVSASSTAEQQVAQDPDLNIESLQALNLETPFNQDDISTTRQLSSLQLSPGTIYSYDQDDFRKYGWRFLADVLRFFPSVFVYDPSLALNGGQRGFVSNFSQTLLLVNGRELNNIVALEAYISRQYTLHNVKRIEVVPGPISSLYGANALAGIIHIITLDQDADFSGLKIGIEAAQHARQAFDITFGQKLSPDWRLTGNGRFYQGNGPDFNHLIQRSDGILQGWEQLALALPHQTPFDEQEKASNWQLTLFGHDFYLGTQQIRNQSGSGFGSANRWLWDDSQDNRKQDWWFAGYADQLSPDIGVKLEIQRFSSQFWGQYHSAFWPVARLETAAGATIFELPRQVITSSGETLVGEQQIRAFYPSFPHYLIDQAILDPDNISREDIETYFTHIYSNKNAKSSTRDRIEGQLDWQLESDNWLTFGFQFTDTYYAGLAVTDAATGIAATYDVPLDQTNRPAVYDSQKYGVFVQHRSALWDNYYLTTGIRYDRQNHYGASTSPRVSLAWVPDNKRSLKFTYGEAFREPNVFELASDETIKPAELSAYEINWIEPLGATNKLNLTLYHNKVTNFLGSVGALIGTGTGTVDSQTVEGVEFQISADYQRLGYFAGGNWITDASQQIIQPNNQSHNQTILGLPRQRLFGGINYRIDYQYDFSLLYEWTADYNALPGNVNLSDPINIADAHQLDFVFNRKWLHFDDFTIYSSLTISNLLDKENQQANIRRSGAVYLPQEGRVIEVRIELVF